MQSERPDGSGQQPDRGRRGIIDLSMEDAPDPDARLASWRWLPGRVHAALDGSAAEDIGAIKL
jgi:hypothetical protein